MDGALLITGLILGATILLVCFVSVWMRFVRQQRILESMSALSGQTKCGLMVFNSAGGIIYKDAYAASCMPFLQQNHMQNAGLAECLEYLALQARLAQPKLGAEILARMSFLPSGEFQEIIGAPDGRFCLVRVQTLDDGTKVLSLFDCDGVYGGASLYRLVQHDKTEALSNLAARMTHNFNNILSITSGNAHILSRKVDAQQSDEHVHLDRIISACERADKINQEMMAVFSRSGDLNDVVDLAAMLDAANSSLYYQVPRHVNLRINAALDSAYVKTSGDFLTRVVDLFLQNAAAAMPDGGTIDLSLDRVLKPSAMLKITITDEAAPMTLSEREHVFDPFSPVRQSSDEKDLGLALARGLVRQLGGYVEVSATRGKGNQFDIYLPQSEAGPSKYVEGKIIDIESFKLHGYQVLVVDDEAGLLEIVSSMLEDLGVDVLQAKHPNDALMLQDEHQGGIDLVLTDIMMPEMNGVHMASMMQSVDERIKIAYMSGFAGRGKASQVEIPQGAPFLPKPFSYEALVHCVYETLVNRSSVSMAQKGDKYGGAVNV